MTNLTATTLKNYDLEAYANAINNGRTDGVYFYVNNNTVTVSYAHSQLSEDFQREELEWFLRGKEYIIN